MTPRSIDREGSDFTIRAPRDTFSLEPLETRTFLSAAVGGHHEGLQNDARVFAWTAARYASVSSGSDQLSSASVAGASNSEVGQQLVFGRRSAGAGAGM